MVRALEKVHRLIKPGGILIDIHPSTHIASIEIRLRDRFVSAGWVHETDDYIEYEWADQAVAAAVDRGLFVLERSSTFSFVWYADTLADLQKYLTEEWKDAFIDAVTFMRAEELMSGIEPDKEVLVRETIQIARLIKYSTASSTPPPTAHDLSDTVKQ